MHSANFSIFESIKCFRIAYSQLTSSIFFKEVGIALSQIIADLAQASLAKAISDSCRGLRSGLIEFLFITYNQQFEFVLGYFSRLLETPTVQNKEQQNYCFNTLNYLLEVQAIASFILVSFCVILALSCLIVTIVIRSGINIKIFSILKLCIAVLSIISVILNIYILALLIINKSNIRVSSGGLETARRRTI
ncbi:hypothetical protein BGW37DRAFT_490820 [Umbelopsis sp. PMI_123]|nr:hypothetical protein BGW37DRAFT_490820 [Umbelopsis sp. PMI_123]